MDPWIPKVIVVASSGAMGAIRAPYALRSLRVKVARSARGPLETTLMTLVWLAFLLPLVWTMTPAFAFADYAVRSTSLVLGTVCLAAGLWFFARSHSDLGTNWSMTLAVRETHALVTGGIYRYLRHPMYLGLLLYATGQALVLSNWIAGPSWAVAMMSVVVFRVGPEERLMMERFGLAYQAYMRNTKRLVPRVW